MKEIWKPVIGYEGLYEVSNLGRVKGLKTGKILQPIKNGYGYLRVTLFKDGKLKKFLVHRLVYEAFNREIPPGVEVNHINDKDKTDNRLCNLNLMTHKENVEYSQAIPLIAYDKSGNFVQEFKSLTEASNWLEKPKAHTNICKNLKGRIPSAYGYVWKYKNPELV